MRRMTISRSRGAALAILLAATIAVGGEAQQAATHTVQRGETLWALAQRYLSDPFLWPQLYRLNTDVVEDPRRIFPGEVLRLAAGETTRVVPATAPADTLPAKPAASKVTGEYDMPEFAQRRGALQANLVGAVGEEAYHRLRAGEYYSSIWLTEGVPLNAGRMLGAVAPPQIGYIREGSPAVPYGRVGVTAPEGSAYAVNDTLLVFQREIGLRGYGDLVTPTGLVRITGRSDQQHLAEVIAVYGAIRHGQEVIPAAGFDPGPKAAPVPVADSLQGEVLGITDSRLLKEPMSRLLIDVGRDRGVAPGDVFQILRVPGPRPNAAFSEADLMAEGQVVRVGARSATILLSRILSPSISAGSIARRVGRLPS